jgi:hypothetical protein
VPNCGLVDYIYEVTGRRVNMACLKWDHVSFSRGNIKRTQIESFLIKF